MKLTIAVLALAMCGCGSKGGPGIGEDAWAWNPPVLCPTICQVWHLGYAAPVVDQKMISCVPDPSHSGNSAGRILANDPNDSKTVVVAFHDGCEVGWGSINFTTK